MKANRRIVDATTRTLLRLGLMRRGTALLETVGRRSGAPRVTPVTNGLIGDEFWIVTEHGGRAGYVRNIESNPRVRVKAGRHWRTGTAHFVPDDPEGVLGRITEHNRAARLNARVVRKVHTDMRVIRVDLDPPGRA